MHSLTRRSLLGGAAAAASLPMLASPSTAAGIVEQLVTTASRPEAVALVRVRLDAAFRAVLHRFDTTEHVHDGWVEVVAWPGDRRRLAEAGATVELVDVDLAASFVSDRLREATLRRERPQERQTYRVLQEYIDDLDRLVELAPDVARRFTLPDATHEGRPIEGVIIGADVAVADTDGRAQAMMCGLHHAREWPSAELTMMFAEMLVEGWLGGDAEITGLLQQLCVFVIPVCNPDGFVRSRETVPYVDELAFVEGLTLYAQEGPYHRKNLRDTLGTGLPYEPQQGIDINRNYPYHWGGVGASDVPVQQTYHGESPQSEPEIVALADLFRRTQILTAISNHTSGDLVLRPWGWTAAPPPDEAALAALGDDMAGPMGYTSGSWNQALYPGTGIIDDWMYGTLGTYCYTLEHGSSFHPAYGDNVPGYWQDNRQAHLKMLHAALDTEQHAIITGTAPAGTVLTLAKDCTIPLSNPVGGEYTEHLEATMVVGDSGAFTWHVNPSPTARTVEEGGEEEPYTLTATHPDGTTSSTTFVVERGDVRDVGPR